MDTLRDDFLYKPEFHRFADFMGLDKHKRTDYDIAKRLLFVYEWGRRKSNSEEFVDVLKAVTKFKKDLGTTVRGETLVKDLYKWARLDYDSLRLRDEKQIYLEKLTSEEKKAMELQERILDRKKKWEEQRDKPLKEAEKLRRQQERDIEELQTQQQELSKQQKEADIKVKEVKSDIPEPEPVEI